MGMENSSSPVQWSWDAWRQDYCYYDSAKSQWIYGNGRVYPGPGQVGFSGPEPQFGVPDTRRHPHIQATRDSKPYDKDQHRNEYPQFPAGQIARPDSPFYIPHHQQQPPYGPALVEPRPQQMYPTGQYHQAPGYQVSTPVSRVAPHSAYSAAGGNDEDRQRDDQNDRNRHGRSHWQDNNPPNSGGHPTGGDHIDDGEETQGVSGYNGSPYRNGMTSRYRAPTYPTN